MAKIPKIVAQRLQNDTQAGVHPDPNLIAAFAENSLKRDERIQVLTHLSQCADCREVALLSAPGQAAAVSAAVGGRTSWLAWPVLRWGAAAACIVVVGAAVGLHYRARPVSDSEIANRRSDTPALEAKVSPESPTPARRELTDLQASQPIQGKRDSAARPTAKRLNQPAAASPSMASAPAPAVAGNLAVDDKLSGRNEAESAKTQPTVEVSAAATGTGMEAGTRSRDEMSQLVPGRAKDALQESDSRARTGIGGGLIAKQAVAPPLAAHKAPLPLAAGILPRWTLSADGALQRSLDSGRTWETIPFPNQANFRALAANGLEIWVGGTKGVLYHSEDAGQRWKLVQPAAGGQALTSDIIRVEFTDSLHGTLTTSDKQTWATEDGGQSWQKR
ncbi:MAG: hypothetical protein LAO09_21500 [Acidobacteriia bacterium]|nr:hypothetical protein [Terriglobia bacterium]